MLGLAVVGAEHELRVIVHTKEPLLNDVLPENVPVKAHAVHPIVVGDVIEFAAKGKLHLLDGQYSLAGFRWALIDGLSRGTYAFLLLDWVKWKPGSQKQFGNPRHIIVVTGISGDRVIGVDPALPSTENPFKRNIRELYAALNSKQQVILIGNAVGLTKKASHRLGDWL